MLESSRTLKNLDQLSHLWFYESTSFTKLPETIGLLTNLHYLQLHSCEKLQEFSTQGAPKTAPA